MLEIREFGEGDLALLQLDIPSGLHPGRAAAHASGDATFLVGWEDGVAVGFLVIVWLGVNEAVVHELIGDCPELKAITVAPALQSRGIGTALIETAEQHVAARGHPRVGLAVGIDNPRARALYERLGYRVWEHGHLEVSWPVVEDPPRREYQTCVYMLKALER